MFGQLYKIENGTLVDLLLACESDAIDATLRWEDTTNADAVVFIYDFCDGGQWFTVDRCVSGDESAIEADGVRQQWEAVRGDHQGNYPCI